MASESDGNGFTKAVEPILKKFVENIDNPFVWMPLGLSIICILAYPITQLQAFPYTALVLFLISLGADWVGRWHNRQTPPIPEPQNCQ